MHCSLEAFVISLFRTNQTDSETFRTLVAIYGREKIARTWEESFRHESDAPHHANENAPGLNFVRKRMGKDRWYAKDDPEGSWALAS